MMELKGRYEDALSNYYELEGLAHERGNEALELASLTPRATIHSTWTDHFDPELGRELCERALRLAQQQNNPQAQAKCYWNLMLNVDHTSGDPELAVEYGEQAIAVAREHGLREELAYPLNDIAGPLLMVGKPDRALAALKEAGELFRELGYRAMVADNLTTQVGGYYLSGQLDKALAKAQEGMAISQSIDSMWGQAYSLITLSTVYLELAEIGRAIETWEAAVPLAEKANFLAPLVPSRIYMSWVYHQMGQSEYGFELVQEALDQAAQIGQSPDFADLLQVFMAYRAGSGGLEEATAASIRQPSYRKASLRLQAGGPSHHS